MYLIDITFVQWTVLPLLKQLICFRSIKGIIDELSEKVFKKAFGAIIKSTDFSDNSDKKLFIKQ